MTKVQNDLRRQKRILVSEEHPIRCESSRPKVQGAITVIGLGGMFIRTNDSHPHGTELNIRIRNEFNTFEAKCAVRNVASNGLGVEFLSLTPGDEQKLRDLLFHITL